MTPTPDASADDSGSRAPQLAVLGLLLAVVVGCLITLGIRIADAGSVSAAFGAAAESAPDTERDAREAVMSQASQFVLRLNTYGPGDLDATDKLPGYAELVSEVVTPKLGADFEAEGLPIAEQVVAQTGYARKADIFATGVESIDADSASVLVAGAFRSSYPDTTSDGRVEFDPQPFRLVVALVRIDGEWLVDNYQPLTGEEEELPGTTPDEPSSTTQPGAGQSTQPGGPTTTPGGATTTPGGTP